MGGLEYVQEVGMLGSGLGGDHRGFEDDPLAVVREPAPMPDGPVGQLRPPAPDKAPAGTGEGGTATETGSCRNGTEPSATRNVLRETLIRAPFRDTRPS